MMRIITLFPLFAVLYVHPQTVLFQETFSGTPAFQLNTTDAGSTTGGVNTWLINNVYQGGSGSLTCLGFPFPFTIPNTAAQPSGITSPNTEYMHISSVAAINSGVLCASFLAADGLCGTAGNHFARMTTDVATVGADEVSLSFWWLCGGGTNNYGEVYYSTNGGSTWVLLNDAPAQYRNQQTWVQQTITRPEFAGQATLRFGFRFVNQVTLSAQDPGFAVDDVIVTSTATAPVSVATNTLPAEVCAGATIQVPYTATGAFQAGNVFTAELSNASGSFASPVVIGSVSATTSGTINATVPPGTPAGSGYLVRVNASAPATTGTPGATAVTIGAAPFAGSNANISLCKNTGVYDLFQFLGTGVSTCGAWTGPGGQAVTGQLDTDTDSPGPYTYTTNCPGGCPQDQAVLTISLINPANAGQDVTTSLCANNPPVNLFNLVQGGDITGLFFFEGQPFQLAQLSTPGVYGVTYVVFGTAPCVNDTADLVITVNAPPQAGASATATVCVYHPPVSLISLLSGVPDAGGTWTGPSGQPFSGTFNPAVDPSGLYTYTVAGVPPCANAVANVAMVVDPCVGIDEQAAPVHVRWLGQQDDGTHVLHTGTMRVRELWAIDAMGRTVARQVGPFPEERLVLTLHGASPGAYTVLLRDMDGQAAALRVLHQR